MLRAFGVTLGAAGIVRAFGGAISASIEWEQALAGVAKTTDFTTEGLAAFGVELRQLSETIPVARNELAGIAEVGGQLGIAEENLASFTETMAALGVSTNLSATEAATSLAQLANIMGTSQDQFDELGSVIVGLGNTFATTERAIAEYGLRLAGAGQIAGLTEAEVLGLGTALSSLGVNAQAGATATQRVLLGLNDAVAQGNESLEVFAATSGLTAEEFSQAWEQDASAAFTEFVEGLGRAGDDATLILEELGLADQRVIRAFLGLAGAGDIVERSFADANQHLIENVALTLESERRYGTLGSELRTTGNLVTNLAGAFGDTLAPVIGGANDLFRQLVDEMRELDRILTGLARNGGWDIIFPQLRDPLGRPPPGLGELGRNALNLAVPGLGGGREELFRIDLPDEVSAERYEATRRQLEAEQEIEAALAAQEERLRGLLDGLRNRTDEERAVTDILQEQVALSLRLIEFSRTRVNETGVLRAELDTLNQIIGDEASTLLEVAAALESRRAIGQSILGLTERQIELQEVIRGQVVETTQHTFELADGVGTVFGVIAQTRDVTIDLGTGIGNVVVPAMVELEGRLEGVHDFTVDTPRSFSRNWVVAISTVGNALGGLGQDLAGIASAALAGGAFNPVGGAIAVGGTLVGRLFGGGDDPMERLAEEAARAADALAALVESTQQDIDVRRLLIAGMDEEAEVLRLQISQGQELAELNQQFEAAFGGFVEDFLGFADDAQLATVLERPEVRAALDQYAELQELHNKEIEALYAEQERIEAERAAKERQRLLGVLGDFDAAVGRANAQLFGGERAVLSFDLAAQLEATIEPFRELVDAGLLSEQALDAFADTLQRINDGSLSEFDAALAESARNARIAAADFQTGLDIQLGELLGEDVTGLNVQQDVIGLIERGISTGLEGFNEGLIEFIQNFGLDAFRELVESGGISDPTGALGKIVDIGDLSLGGAEGVVGAGGGGEGGGGGSRNLILGSAEVSDYLRRMLIEQQSWLPELQHLKHIRRAVEGGGSGNLDFSLGFQQQRGSRVGDGVLG